MVGAERQRWIMGVVVVAVIVILAGMLMMTAEPQSSRGEEIPTDTRTSTTEEPDHNRPRSLLDDAARNDDRTHQTGQAEGEPDQEPQALLQLRSAILAGSEAQITAAIEAGADVNADLGQTGVAHEGWTPLLLASETAAYPAVMALLEAGASTEARTPEGLTPLHLAAASRDPSAIRAILEAGADLDATTPDSRTPLHTASASPTGSSQLAALLEAGADPNPADQEGLTPLMNAAQLGDLEKVITLLNAGADPTLRDNAGKNAADHAANNPRITSFLREATR